MFGLVSGLFIIQGFERIFKQFDIRVVTKLCWQVITCFPKNNVTLNIVRVK
jgi:hypothetical protein